MQKETLQLSIILTSHAKQFYHLKPHRGHTGKKVDPRCGRGGITKCLGAQLTPEKGEYVCQI